MIGNPFLLAVRLPEADRPAAATSLSFAASL
jgi:hypothetical protein